MRSSASQRVFVSIFAAVGLVCAAPPGSPNGPAELPAAHQWPQWRGPLSTGVAPHASPPVEWSEAKNVRWKTALPGMGHSTPVVWGDRVFVTTAAPFGDVFPAKLSGAKGGHDEVPITQRQKFMVIALDRRTGKVAWERTLREEVPHQGGHVTASLASSSPITDGERVYACFGSWGLYCLDAKGDLVWNKPPHTLTPVRVLTVSGAAGAKAIS